MTSAARTYLDLAEVAKQSWLPAFLKRGDELGVLDYYEVLACCERSRRHRGAKPLRRALSVYRPERRFTRSGAERRFLELVEAAGLPLPATNYIVGAHELDAYWAAAGLAVEIDAFATHGTRASFESDRKRDAELAAVGITVVRITEHRLAADPAGVAAQLSALLGARPAAARPRRASPPSPV
ncbi:MAG: endonuclease domain-containing protein [Solirubrobacterales bacterium]